MPFYEELATFYDAVFPLDPIQVEFAARTLPAATPETRILDVGCGTGDLAISLARQGFTVDAIDTNEEMIRRAHGKVAGGEKVTFRVADMRTVSSSFNHTSFDGILCFGNTLVHLEGPGEIAAFLEGAGKIMKQGAPFLFQILNYDHILDHHIRALPLIETDEVTFERSYEYPREAGRILFSTVLTVKGEGRRMKNELFLYPVRKKELEALLSKTGFGDIVLYGDFKGSPLSGESLPLVGIARYAG